MKILSLFDGMSVAQQALKNAGIKVDAYYASEIDPYAIATTQSNFPDTIQVGSVVDLKGSDFQDIDLICGGSPCQDLSIAKKGREGLSGARSGLFWEYVRILKEVKPKYFILENVNSMPKEAKELITETLWGIEPVLLNAALVSAQNRKRLFWVGKLDEFGTYKKVEIPQPKDEGILLKDILEENVDERYNVHSDNWRISRNTRDKESKSRCLNASNFKGALNDGMTLVLNNDGTEKLKSNTIRTSGHRSGIDDKHKLDTIRIGSLNSGGQGDRVYSPNGKATTLSANGGGRGAKTGLYAVAQRGRNIVNGKRKDILGAKTEQRIEIGQSEKAHTITSVFKDSMIMENSIIRKLTPIECLRLQSMPDDYFDKAIYKGKPISNSQRYKMAGNAFNCKVVEHIIKRLN